MNYVQLREMCCITMGQSPNSDSYNEEREGVPFFQGNADFGERYPSVRTWCKEPKKMAKNGDVLISVRAPIGAINYARETCCIGRGLAALSPKTDKVSKEFIFWVMKSRCKELQMKGTGSTFKAISKKILEEVKIPLYPLEKQIEYSLVLEKVYAIIETYKSELQKLDELIQARFVEMFGDPVCNSHDLPEATLPELGEFGRGVSKHRPRNDSNLLGGRYPLIQTGDVATSELYITSYTNTYSELGLKQSKMWKKGTLCITIAATIAKTAILAFDACFPDSVVGFIANEKTNNVFVHYWFTFFQSILEAQAPESAQKNINLKILSELKIIVPKKELQDEFVTFVNQVNKSKVEIQKALEKTQLLFDSLMQQYFG